MSTLEKFVDALRGIPAEEFHDDRVLAVVRAQNVDPADLEPFLVWRPDRYTRSLLYRDELFMVLVLCWNIGQTSPVHDHAGQRCWMRVEQGHLEMANYACKANGVIEYVDTEVVGPEGQDVHVDQCACVHQISNRCAWSEPAVSLHVYSKPFDDCYIYDLASGTREKVELCCDRVGPLARGDRGQVATG